MTGAAGVLDGVLDGGCAGGANECVECELGWLAAGPLTWLEAGVAVRPGEGVAVLL
ncbi:MAG TPA: hypothetical protein VGI00_05995 [Streptosporangiaceae bacterium]